MSTDPVRIVLSAAFALYFRVKRRGQPVVSLADQRQIFIDRWRSLAAEVAAA